MIILSWWFLITVSTRYSSIDKDPQGPTLYSYHICGICIVYEINFFCPKSCEIMLYSLISLFHSIVSLSARKQWSNGFGARCRSLESDCTYQSTATKFTNAEFLNDRIILNFICQIEMTLRWPQMTFIIYFSNLDFKFRNENAKWFFCYYEMEFKLVRTSEF